MNNEEIGKFAQSLRGTLIGRDHVDYDEVRKLYNGTIDRRPLLIARCENVADVIAAVNFGRDSKLAIAIRGGGHNGPGFGSVDEGLVIDLSMMKGVRVDPANRTVRVGAGCTTGDVDHATHAFGLAIPFGIVSTTGVAGLTLSGGHGYLSRQYGLAVDNLIEADVVLADGTFVIANKTDSPDLLWGLRGGGGNFGVVTSFLFEAHPASTVYGRPDLLGVERRGQDHALVPGLSGKRAGRVLRLPRAADGSVRRSLPEGPLGQKDLCSPHLAQRAGNGRREGRQRRPRGTSQADHRFCGPDPLHGAAGHVRRALSEGLQWYWKGDFVKTLPDAAIDAHIEQAAKVPSEASCMHLYPIDGAVHRKAEDETAWNCRDATWSMVIAGVDPDPGQAPALKKWANNYWEAVHPFDLGGAYPNFMMDNEGEARLKATYGDNYIRLGKLKKKYDPANLFRVNQNIRPAA